MKKTMILTAMAALMAANCMADSYGTIYTKGGKAVQILIRGEQYSSSEKQEYAEYYQQTFPLAVMLGDATTTYNCHSYAWNMTDGGDVCWINQYDSDGNANILKYWTNDYYAATTEDKAVKVFYYDSDHSAVVSKTVSGMYESKWGAMPLMRHAPGYGPYMNMDKRRYYKDGEVTPPPAPTVVYGLLTCSNGVGEIRTGVAATYSAKTDEPMDAYRMSYLVMTTKDEDAVELGRAVVNEVYGRGVRVTFTRAGAYMIYVYFYNRYDQLVGEFWFEPLVTE